MGHTVPVRRAIVRTRLADPELEALDAFADDQGLTRAAALRLLVANGLDQARAQGSLTTRELADPGVWPANSEVRLELARRQLWSAARGGSVQALIALERSLARERGSAPMRQSSEAEPDDPFAEVDALAEARQRLRRAER